MRQSKGRLTVTVVALLLGFLVVVQLRAQSAEEGLGTLTVQDLTVLVANLNTRNGQLADEIAALERQRDALAAAVDRGDTTAGQVRTDLGRVEAWSGTVPVTGPGVTVAVAGPLSAPALGLLLNELRNAGAEAIAVNGIRIVTGDAVGRDADGLRVGEQAITGPYALAVIGQPETMIGSLTRLGGPIAQIGARYPDVLLTVTAEDRLNLPATTRDLSPDLARPRL